jgi:hypothetical protein
MDKAEKVYKWFAASYQAITGRRISFPSNTDPTKTYQYRSIKRFTTKIDEWEMSDSSTKFLIKEVIKYSKERGLLSRGVSVLDKIDLLEECYGRMQRYVEQHTQLLSDIASSHDFFNKNKHKALSSKRGGYPFFVMWYQSGKLCVEFIALSKSCLSVIGSLNSDDIKRVPDLVELLSIRHRYLRNSNLKTEIKEILGEDLYED